MSLHALSSIKTNVRNEIDATKRKPLLFLRFSGYFLRSSRKSPANKSAVKINPDKHEHEFCNYNSLERQPPYLYFGLLFFCYYYFFFIHFTAN